MQIHLNGQPHTIASPFSIGDLLTSLDLQDKRVAIELNQQIIPRGMHPSTRLKEGDVIEVIEAIAGG